VKELVLLYYLYLAWGSVGQGKVSILELSRWMRKSKTQMKEDIFKLADMGLIDLHVVQSAQKKYFVSLSVAGQTHLSDNHKEAYQAYRLHVAETISLIKQRGYSDKQPQRLSKKEIRAIAAGQKGLFDE
jgi:DNA-binding MarR family transcriptional regulator